MFVPSFLKRRGVVFLFLSAFLLSGCSIKRMAVNKMGDALSGSGGAFSSDDDPDFIKDATPFSLKLMESLLDASPNHEGLLKASCSGFTSYSYAFLQCEADYSEAQDLEKAQFLRGRAKRMYLRALGYGMRGLDQKVKGFSTDIRKEPEKVLARLKKDDVELLYWTSLSWFGAINLGKDDMSLIGDLGIAEKCMARALELDPDWGEGSIHEFYVTFDTRSSAMGGSMDRAKDHFKKALDLSKGRKVSTYLTYAESICVSTQDKPGFEDMVNKALAIDPDADKSTRLLTLVYQKRARWLLTQEPKLFAE